MTQDSSALKAIIRLKAGLCPLERLEDITIGLTSHTAHLGKLLGEGLGTGERFGIVLGPYGSGKTHVMQIAKRVALQHHFAVAHLSQDTGLSSLGHPQRHVFNLLRSLRFPSPYGSLLEWLGTSLEHPQQLRALESSFQELASECRSVVEAALWILQQAPRNMMAGLLLEYLSGVFLIGKTAHTTSRLRAYELVRFWALFSTRILGCKGFVLLIDELENLFSNAVYWNILSRRCAYRTLSYYTEALPHATTIGALTPDGWKLLRSEVQHGPTSFLLDGALAAVEKMPSLFSRILKTAAYELTAFTSSEYRQFFEKLVALHSEARGYPRHWVDGHPIAPRAAPGLTPRIFAKSVVSALERIWFSRVGHSVSGPP